MSVFLSVCWFDCSFVNLLLVISALMPVPSSIDFVITYDTQMHVQLVLEMTTSLLASSVEGKSYFHSWKFRFSLGTSERRREKSEFPFCKQTMLESSLTVVWSCRCLYFPPPHPHGIFSISSIRKLPQVRPDRPLVYRSSSLPAREMRFFGLHASV